MKKQYKFMAVLSAAAIVSTAAPIFGTTLFPASIIQAAQDTGWVNEDDQWRFKDTDDYYLSDSWKKRDGEWYYLNDEGNVTTNSKVDEYYVDEEGKRVTGQWIILDNEDNFDSDAPDQYWYYYGKDGKSVVSKWQIIDDKSYYFNEDGQMQTGQIEVEGEYYYLGEEGDGVKKTGWIQLENQDMDLDADYIWHYYDSKGRMIMNEVDYKIADNYYTFIDGIMKAGWYKLPVVKIEETATASDAAKADDSGAASIKGYQYYMEDGKRASGWLEIEGAPEVSEDGETYSFYFKKGEPTFAATGIQLFTISSKRYAFNTKGEMQTGLETITQDDGATAKAYLGADGVVLTGKQTIYDEDLDATRIWFFSTEGTRKGLGVQGIRDNVIYYNGQRQDALSEIRYAPVELDGAKYLVNTSGVIQKATSSSKSQSKPELGSGFKDLTDENDVIYTVDVNGIIK